MAKLINEANTPGSHAKPAFLNILMLPMFTVESGNNTKLLTVYIIILKSTFAPGF